MLGALLYAVQGLRSSTPDAQDAARTRITIEADRLLEMRTTFAEQMGRAPEDAEVDRMIAAEVDEEILYREAVARGLLERDSGVQTRLIQKMLFLEGASQDADQSALLARAVELGLERGDIVVRRILVQKMKLLGSALASTQRPTLDEIESDYRSSQDSLRAADRRTITHAFFSSDRRGSAAYPDALALRATLDGGRPSRPEASADAISTGDPFPLGHRLENRSRHALERSFGERFGEATFELEPGVWSAPIASAYGYHLVRVDHVEPGSVPPLEQVADRLRLEIEDRRRNENLEMFVSDLRTRYQVVLPKQTPETNVAGQHPGAPAPPSEVPPSQRP